ncbi:hypothetical protein TRP8649_02891 [Pelagimonas phthalicica]|uniref:Uncharacterized protein n=1 Tax=Pelagimonas phthalicica TaxID=1037362 RepID=A0A238JEC4_9RHOB|nr:hypothetical protein [Pelagimonas phthalicica]TDS91716.1 hypothetical protein CLV87_2892 [Pelagimonas phthalicica]SMX28765.1 hypothetical protein TRP8649_02891 [Pelagimonas phthalicica]
MTKLNLRSWILLWTGLPLALVLWLQGLAWITIFANPKELNLLVLLWLACALPLAVALALPWWLIRKRVPTYRLHWHAFGLSLSVALIFGWVMLGEYTSATLWFGHMDDAFWRELNIILHHEDEVTPIYLQLLSLPWWQYWAKVASYCFFALFGPATVLALISKRPALIAVKTLKANIGLICAFTCDIFLTSVLIGAPEFYFWFSLFTPDTAPRLMILIFSFAMGGVLSYPALIRSRFEITLAMLPARRSTLAQSR